MSTVGSSTLPMNSQVIEQVLVTDQQTGNKQTNLGERRVTTKTTAVIEATVLSRLNPPNE